METARDLIKRLVAAFPESPRIRHWARVLAPPTTRSVMPLQRRSFAPEHAWLRAHAREYPGCRLAILGDHLLAADPDLRKVLERAHQVEGGTEALLHLQPKAFE